MVEHADKEGLERPLVTCICNHFFKDAASVWHQPGTKCEFTRDEAGRLQGLGYIQIIETASVEQPNTRNVNFKRRNRNAR